MAISYDEEQVTFYQAEGKKLVIREYMTDNKGSYYALVRKNRDTIHVSEGGKPFCKRGFCAVLKYICLAPTRKPLQ